MVKNLLAIARGARDEGLILGSGRSPEVGNGNPLQYSLPRKFHGQESLVHHNLNSHKELDKAE